MLAVDGLCVPNRSLHVLSPCCIGDSFRTKCRHHPARNMQVCHAPCAREGCFGASGRGSVCSSVLVCGFPCALTVSRRQRRPSHKFASLHMWSAPHQIGNGSLLFHQTRSRSQLKKRVSVLTAPLSCGVMLCHRRSGSGRGTRSQPKVSRAPALNGRHDTHGTPASHMLCVAVDYGDGCGCGCCCCCCSCRSNLLCVAAAAIAVVRRCCALFHQRHVTCRRCATPRHRAAGGGGGWHEAMLLVCLPLAAPIGLSPLYIPTLCGSERVLVVSTEPLDDLSCLTTPGSAVPEIGEEGGGGGRDSCLRNRSGSPSAADQP